MFQFDKARRNGARQERPIAPVYDYIGYWLVSDTLKEMLVEYNSQAFDFVECRTQFPEGEPGPRYWLTDIISVRDCVDDERSRAAGARMSPGRGWVELNGVSRNLVYFHHEPLRDAKIFRVPTFVSSIFCTTSAREFLLQSGFNDCSFLEVGRVA